MIDRATKLRLRRKYRRRKKQVEFLGERTGEHFDRHIFRRMNSLPGVRRFIFGWFALLTLIAGCVITQTRSLSNYYQTYGPAAGGTYTEGVMGVLTNANPLYAATEVDSAVSRLVFSSLLTTNENGRLVNDLAEKWTVDATGTHYTVTLRKGLKWHDGQPVTSADIVFTYGVIQNPDAKSPLNSSWQGVTIAAKDQYTVEFVLSNALSAFPYSLTNGIVPKHSLADIPVSQMRSAPFNTVNPVGTGPFRWDSVQVNGGDATNRTQQVVLLPNANYYAGEPKLNRFVIKSYVSEDALRSSFKNHELTAMAGIDSIDSSTSREASVNVRNLTLSSAIMVFLKTTDPLLGDLKIRQALTQATNQKEVLANLGYSALIVTEPLLKNQLGYNPALRQLSYSPDDANRLLDEAGWKRDATGKRVKDGQPLTVTVTSQSNPEYLRVLDVLKKQWQAVGVQLTERLLSEDEVQRSSLRAHSYQALLYGISIGADPDIFAYWHSSQILGGLNLAAYKNATADQALEAGRTRSDEALRVAKYKAFLEAWDKDAPAIGLYQPRFLYVTRGPLYNFTASTITGSSDRYVNVHNWMVRQEKIVR